MLPDTLSDRVDLWLESGKGIKTRMDSGLNPSIVSRDDIGEPVAMEKIERGNKSQQARLNYYPSIDVDRDKLYAGYIEGDIEDAREALFDMGYRNNPTAYVEVTEENGPDDGSYARQYITETGTDLDVPRATSYPGMFNRLKRQVHVCIWQVGDKVEFLAHEEKSAWLQPMLHVAIPDVQARIGVQEFRRDWYNEFGEELNGKDGVKWETSH